MQVQEHVAIGRKTTMRIGGTARYYIEVATEADVEAAYVFARRQGVPVIPLGGGSNTVFAEGEMAACVVKCTYAHCAPDGAVWRLGGGAILASCVNTLAQAGYDASALTGIPGTVGGAVFGNAGQGPKGVWIDRFVRSVRVFVAGEWKTYTATDCGFRYRESVFKDMADTGTEPPLIWEVAVDFPVRSAAEILAEIDRLIRRRLETQPHLKTAGSCFKALPDGTPAWQLIEQAGLRGQRFGGVEISQKHANFLLNVEQATSADVRAAVAAVRSAVPQIASVEMRLYGLDGRVNCD